MRHLIFTDVHGNMEALSAVLKSARKKKIDRFVFLGDLVGYGASPNEVIKAVKKLSPLSLIRGNHDKAVCGLDPLDTFNPMAAVAITWCREKITPQSAAFLCGLKPGPLVLEESITICHGAPFDEDYYIFGEFDAAEAFDYLKTPVGFFGHTHFPCIYSTDDHYVKGIIINGDNYEIQLQPGVKYLINPGSVGQPRDRNSKAAYALYDSKKKTVLFRRVEYDIAAAQAKIMKNNLPPALAERLALGI